MPKDPRSVQQVNGTAAARKANYTGGRPNDESKLSRNPQQIRNRLRRRGQKMSRDLEMYIEEGGIKPLEEWDFEELARGKPRAKDGKFKGPAPGWVTQEIVKEAKRRLLHETFGDLARYGTKAVATIYRIMMSEEVDDKGRPIVDARTRLDAAKFIIEHIMGKPKAVIEVEAEDLTRRLLASAIVLDDGLPQDEPVVLEGDFEEVDDADVE